MYINTVDTQRKYSRQRLDYMYLFMMSTLLIQRLENIVDLMELMLTLLILSNYNVNPNTKYSNYIEY